jgi:hypothetical protein
VKPLHVAATIEQLGRERSAPTAKLRLARVALPVRLACDGPGHAGKPGFICPRTVATAAAWLICDMELKAS